jgi:hypothetical protein
MHLRSSAQSQGPRKDVLIGLRLISVSQPPWFSLTIGFLYAAGLRVPVTGEFLVATEATVAPGMTT